MIHPGNFMQVIQTIQVIQVFPWILSSWIFETPLNDRDNKEGGLRRWLARENADDNNNKQGAQSPPPEVLCRCDQDPQPTLRSARDLPRFAHHGIL